MPAAVVASTVVVAVAVTAALLKGETNVTGWITVLF